jgi:peptide-methionine (R)-S-oxide reductase
VIDRRGVLAASVSVAGALLLLKGKGGFMTLADAKPADALVDLILFDDAGKNLGATRAAKVVKSDAEWRAQLTALQFEVARKHGTERAFSGDTYNLHDRGLYRCICCHNALFSSDTKYDSGTGWPSFWAPIAPQNVRISNDNTLGMLRSEVSCAQCDAHLGHVFDDGPPPTHLRYCMNSASLKFRKKA